MEILPKTLGTRPRLAVEIRTDGAIAARAEDVSAVLSGIAHTGFAEGSVVPGLKMGNIADRTIVVAALRESLDSLTTRGGDRGKDVTIVVPDAAARVLLLEFDDLPGKAAEALSVVRFRLKKLLPFDADNADEAFNSLLCEMVDEVIALLKLNVALAIAAPGNQPTKHPRDVERFECGGGIGSIDFVEK